MKSIILGLLLVVLLSAKTYAQISGNCGAYNEESRTYADNCQWSYDEISSRVAEQGYSCQIVLDYGMLGAPLKVLVYRVTI